MTAAFACSCSPAALSQERWMRLTHSGWSAPLTTPYLLPPPRPSRSSLKVRAWFSKPKYWELLESVIKRNGSFMTGGGVVKHWATLCAEFYRYCVQMRITPQYEWNWKPSRKTSRWSPGIWLWISTFWRNIRRKWSKDRMLYTVSVV